MNALTKISYVSRILRETGNESLAADLNEAYNDLEALIQAARLGQMFVQNAMFEQEDNPERSRYVDGYPKRAYDDIDRVISGLRKLSEDEE